tara:strand:- start:53 stop:772 length:720 start_codon:yes stop_codon:yes gene_type:complete
MKKEKKIKIFLATIYLVIILCFLWAFFDNFSLSEVTSYNFIKNNNELFKEIREKNFLFVSLLFFVLTVIWVFLLGFGTPVILLSGFIFGKWIGSFYAIFGLTIGATLLYIFSNFFLKDLIEKKFSKKFSNLNEKFKNNEFNFFLIYRFVGGIPFFISNILPTIFNIKVKNFFYGSLIGMYPQVFLMASIGSGLDSVIENNLQAPSIKQILFSSEIYIPLFGFLILIILGFILKNIFFEK